ncbi:MAG: DUF192 domain-containing protein [Mesorhizobium sp.]|uniref:DUF192 domain-containing protein n=1 Tax=unclassified Mesorhizobium TaxID=325217 RepID=UPI000F765323|nr:MULTISPECIES: DUF192 domain-containing protein [unclassified Mesorhizobium]TGV88248.1 DUF192 domain-containing protein [Mesorhizobium sp. M00.F.Ca.ET.158.01.1.1]AZO62689.1 DUF192 domain-containing protein [Mesorhizobium sp. M1A.F.Ca.IN.022.06.1.1]MCT2577705.1 DUF192 domain-containing protein [Mesorhizobium sp. P13.3]MDF3166643.1 DUF192 domain-containing protein [Mesorhizobium sp. P16.1]MDF3179353.1 DUF192 domain-containing protein [Mesorhizobium sp. P17.1]
MAHRNWLTAGALCAAIALAAIFSALRPSSADGQAMMLPADPTPLVAITGSGKHSFSIEIADSSEEREAGLMYRKDMADDHGMLFVFERPAEVNFWMKNTPMPLDLVFIGQDGRIKAVKRGEPESEAIISPGQPVSFVLELKAGTAAKDGLKDGDLLRHPAIDKASGAGSN